FDAVDVFAAADQHVLGAVENVDEAFVVHAHEVARMEPGAFGDRGSGRFRLVPVALHDVRAPDPEFADLTARQLVALLVHHLDVADGHGDAGAVRLRDIVLGEVLRGDGRGFGETVTVGRLDLRELLLDPGDEVRRRRRAAITDGEHARGVARREV